ncbi:tRNA methyltransferase complex GCD14 subunit [Hymenopellis radicata]|nr:tRNA methyltransferase complex GCD14 subunit [Hymenopellis radicata]
MWSTERTISDGDVVIVWLTRDMIQPLQIQAAKDFNSRFGNYRQSDFIGIPYGSKVGAKNGKGFVHLLRPTPELWTMALPHRTQILYIADISFITSYLNIHKGSTVIEAGTGSASFSHSVIRTIGSSGHLWSYEFHEARAEKAREEFTRHGFLDIVTLTHRNVCKDGFTVTDTADSLFLDIPAPWDAIAHAKTALRKDCITRICCFSPCMEQVLRTVNALKRIGLHGDNHVPVPLKIGEISERLKKAEARREVKRLRQIAQNQAKGKRKREDGEDGEGEAEGKRVKTEEEKGDEVVEMMQETIDDGEETQVDEPETEKMSVSKVMSEVRGHTSYLTFASLMPAHPSMAPQLDDFELYFT